MRVLVVEDHVVLAERIAEGLRDAGMAADVAFDGRQALDSAASVPYDVVVLDRDLPVVHGDRVCKELASYTPAPRIIMLTASAEVHDRIDGFELGADDYLCKPFAFEELTARIRALARREPSQPAILHRWDLTIDRARIRVSRSGQEIRLTKKEFAVLAHLATANGAVVSAEELLEHEWDENIDPFSNTVAVTVARLRKKLGEPVVIETVVGRGYRM
ncbi:transcriptional regulator [Arthrobacter sp. ERGS1:01]|uniref:response regulator transcription factor n=1 Tax=Arthrobacter sp. ERGS1:01 TaxID=1704044 RepID=UPI0006B44057|nr:transcriptional regulator [Arthrobacter sp. ERGS1:01]